MYWYYEQHRDQFLSPVTFCSPGLHPRHCHPHLHYNIELLYVTAGDMTVTLYSKEAPITDILLRPGEAILFNSCTIHETKSKETSGILTYIPANSLPSALRIPVGQTPSRAVKDENGLAKQLLLAIAAITKQSGFRNSVTQNNDSHTASDTELSRARRTALANAVLSLLHPAFCETLMDIRTPSYEADLMQYIYENYRNPDLSVKKLCTMFGYTPKTLSRVFLDQSGTGVKRYIDTLRINDARQLLIRDSSSIDTVAKEVGYDCPRTFYRVFTAHTGQTPNEYRKNSRTDL